MINDVQNQPSPLMTVAEVCTYLRCGRDTLMSYVRANQFVQPVQVGRRYLFDRAAVVAFFRVQAIGYEVQAKLYDVLERLAKTSEDDGVKLWAQKSLVALESGNLDVDATINELSK